MTFLDAPIGRRRLLVGAAGLATLLLAPRASLGLASKTKLILLGTGGGPRPRKTRSASAQVIVVNDTAYVVDCGDGVARQLVLADVKVGRAERFDMPVTRRKTLCFENARVPGVHLITSICPPVSIAVASDCGAGSQ